MRARVRPRARRRAGWWNQGWAPPSVRVRWCWICSSDPRSPTLGVVPTDWSSGMAPPRRFPRTGPLCRRGHNSGNQGTDAPDNSTDLTDRLAVGSGPCGTEVLARPGIGFTDGDADEGGQRPGRGADCSVSTGHPEHHTGPKPTDIGKQILVETLGP